MKRWIRNLVWTTGAMLLAMAAGCQDPLHFPMHSMDRAARDVGAAEAYDADHDGQADLFFYEAPGDDRRIVRIAYDRDGDAKPDRTIELDAIPVDQCRHLVVILDGFAWHVVQEYRKQGGLRLFHRPSKVVAPYPTLTDMCLEDLLGHVPVAGFEAEYYDHRRDRVVGGATSYLSGRNQPYNRLLQYRANLILDAVGYVVPWKVFGHEIDNILETLDKRQTREVLAYVVSAAGVSTRDGRDGQVRCLRKVDRLVRQVVTETQGLTKVTLVSDHGHSYTRAQRAPLEKHLKDKGWRLRNRLCDPNDVVFVRFGLVTYASLSTRRPAALARDLASAEGVDLVSHRNPSNPLSVVVTGSKDPSSDGPAPRAIIRRTDNGRFVYEPVVGDPLELKDALRSIKPDRGGSYDPDDLLKATVDAKYPAPLQRIWRAHFSLVENPPDVIVSLKDSYYTGSASFGRFVDVASTHGSLNRTNSVTFLMSTAGRLPSVLRSRDVPGAMAELLEVPAWPMRK